VLLLGSLRSYQKGSDRPLPDGEWKQRKPAKTIRDIFDVAARRAPKAKPIKELRRAGPGRAVRRLTIKPYPKIRWKIRPPN